MITNYGTPVKQIIFSSLQLPPAPWIADIMTIFTNTVYSDTIFTNNVCSDTIFTNTVYSDTIFTNTVYSDTIFTNNVCSDTIFTSTVCSDTIFTSTVCSDTIFTSNVCSDTIFTSNVCSDTIFTSTVFSNTMRFSLRARKPSFMSIRRCVYSYAYRFFYFWVLNLILCWGIHFSEVYGRKILRNFVW